MSRPSEQLVPRAVVRHRAKNAGWLACAVGVAMLAVCGDSVFADDLPGVDAGKFQLNGFGTVGAIATDISQPWNFRRDFTQSPDSGARVNASLGVQANYLVSPKWEFVGQAVAKSQTGQTSLSQWLKLGFVSYKPTPDTTLRLGRTTPDVFLLANYRDVNFAYPWVRPNLEYYSWVPVISSDGLDITQAWHTNSVLWRAKAGYGRLQNTLSLGKDDKAKISSDDLLTLSLSSEFDGLTVKLSYSTSHQTLSDAGSFDQLVGALQPIESLASQLPPDVVAQERGLVQGLKIDHEFVRYMGLGLLYDKGPWLLHGELGRINGEIPQVNGLRGYASVGYRIGAFMPYVMAGRVLPKWNLATPPTDWIGPLTPLVGPTNAANLQQVGVLAAAGLNVGRESQRSFTLGTRWDINTRTSLKLQWDYFHVYENGSGLWGNGTPDAAYANVFSAAVDFMF